MEFWQSIGTLDFILDVIKEGYKIPFISTPPPKHYSNNASALREADFVDQAIAELLADNCVEELYSPPVILNPLTLSVQTSGKKRLMLDLRHIICMFLSRNLSVKVCIPFVMSFQNIFFVLSFYLKSGYDHVDIFPEHRAFLAFSWDFGTGVARYFQFTVLPFGLSSAPFIFTKLLKPLETLWRSRFIPVAIFFDDGVGAGQSVEVANHNSSVVRSDLARAGFQINREKSDWQPKPCFSWIGYTIDTYSGLICATDSRIGKLSSELVDICLTLEESRFVHVKRIASIVGQIVSLSPSSGTVTQIITRYLHFIVNSRHSWSSSVFVHDQGKNELFFWRDNLKSLNGVLFWPVPFVPSVVIFSDASANGCAAFIQGTDLVFQRNWSSDESEKSSTWRELAAIKFSIEAFGTRLSKQRVRWHTNSQNAV